MSQQIFEMCAILLDSPNNMESRKTILFDGSLQIYKRNCFP